MEYPGGKNNDGVYQRIINLIPPHTRYIEPFLGSGAIMRYKLPAGENIGIEMDSAALMTTMESLNVGCHEVPNCGYFSGQVKNSKLANGRALYSFYNCDALEWLDGRRKSLNGRWQFLYADPPYVRSARRSAASMYKFELDDADHVRLLNVLNGLDCNIMISGYESNLYNDLLPGWNKYTFEAITRGGKMATEVLWMNYPTPMALHDYRYLGETFREREKIKRQKTRWVNRLQRMNPLQKRAMMWALSEIDLSGDRIA